jgi:hypothetical protein
MRYSQFAVKAKKKFSLKDCPPDYTGEFKNEDEARESIERDIADLGKYQDILAAHEKYGLLIIFQGMDAAGKDPIIKHIFSAVDPQGCETKSFKNRAKKNAVTIISGEPSPLFRRAGKSEFSTVRITNTSRSSACIPKNSNAGRCPTKQKAKICGRECFAKSIISRNI